MINLLRNAAQARGDAATEIVVKAELDPSGLAILVMIDDDGPGVPSEHRRAVFAPGFSLRPGGTGQGLALVREVVESELSGEAYCQESPLGGARFVVRLPVLGARSKA